MEELQPKTDECRILIGSNNVLIIDKLFGPTAACDLRISFDLKNYQWVVERQRYTHPDGLEFEWVELARQDMQPEDDVMWRSAREEHGDLAT